MFSVYLTSKFPSVSGSLQPKMLPANYNLEGCFFFLFSFFCGVEEQVCHDILPLVTQRKMTYPWDR